MRGDPLITFISDFGTREYYVGAVKGAILSVCPTARIIDVSHEVASHDLVEGAFTLACACSAYPPRTIHLVVVDPGVGSSRRGLIVLTESHIFVGPDNGVFSLVCDRETVSRTVSIEAEHYFRRPVSPTFHARDIFGPVAAWIARGIDLSKFGPDIKDYVRLAFPPVQKVAERRLEGIVLHIDKFGNVITSLSPGDLLELFGKDLPVGRFLINEREVTQHCRFYSEGAEQELFSLVGSSGYFEIASYRKPAARLLEARRGMKVHLEVVT